MGQTRRQKVEVRKAQEEVKPPKGPMAGLSTHGVRGRVQGTMPAGPELVTGPCAEGVAGTLLAAGVGLRARPASLPLEVPAARQCRCTYLGWLVNSTRNLQRRFDSDFPTHFFFSQGLVAAPSWSLLMSMHLELLNSSAPWVLGAWLEEGFPGREEAVG